MFYNRGHDEYLSKFPNYDFPIYRQVVHDCTEEFSSVSKKIIDIENKFAELGKTEVSGYIRKLQELEKEKLDVVSVLHGLHFLQSYHIRVRHCRICTNPARILHTKKICICRQLTVLFSLLTLFNNEEFKNFKKKGKKEPFNLEGPFPPSSPQKEREN